MFIQYSISADLRTLSVKSELFMDYKRQKMINRGLGC